MAIGTGTALLAAGLTAAGGVKGVRNKQADARERAIRTATIRNSPWTGMKDPGETSRAGVFESMLQGGLTGALMGQSIPAGTAAGLPGSEQGMAKLMAGSAAPIQSSALGGNVLNTQLNPALQKSTWEGVNPAILEMLRG